MFAVREGVEAWRGDACTTPVAMLTGAIEDHDHTIGEIWLRLLETYGRPD